MKLTPFAICELLHKYSLLQNTVFFDNSLYSRLHVALFDHCRFSRLNDTYLASLLSSTARLGNSLSEDSLLYFVKFVTHSRPLKKYDNLVLYELIHLHGKYSILSEEKLNEIFQLLS